MKFCSTVLLATIIMCSATAQEAFYLANEGVMVSDGDTRILFDPLYPESYGQYLLVPEEMRRALFAGEAPFDGVDAVFISHFHGDHFSPGDVLALMQAQADIALLRTTTGRAGHAQHSGRHPTGGIQPRTCRKPGLRRCTDHPRDG
jgi:glyoxylase-like metal-dependent hydrolase (beta-lactamase superfamily II)